MTSKDQVMTHGLTSPELFSDLLRCRAKQIFESLQFWLTLQFRSGSHSNFWTPSQEHQLRLEQLLLNFFQLLSAQLLHHLELRQQNMAALIILFMDYYVWYSCFNFVIGLYVEVPQYLYIFFPHNSFRLVLIPVSCGLYIIRSTNVPVQCARHTVMSSFVLFLSKL